MNDRLERLRKLSTLMCYIRAAQYFDTDDSIEEVIVHWYNYTYTPRCTIERVFKNNGTMPHEFIGNSPLCQYIMNTCFTHGEKLVVDVKVKPPNSHQIVEASFQLIDMLGPEVNVEEFLY